MKRQSPRVLLSAAVLLAAWGGPAPAGAPVIGTPEDVAPKVEKTRLQKWPRAAWAAESKCWLVVWREGDISEDETDIWCARFGADGKPLDPAGIRVTSAKGLQDRPAIASDGKGFIVAWSDFRNGKDYDVYAARVSGEGKLLDGDGIPLALGEHNQCQPTATFAAGNYLVAWQGFVERAMKFQSKSVPMEFGSYEVRGTRVSIEGKVLDPDGNVLAATTAIQPALASDGAGNVWLAFVGHSGSDISSRRPRHFPAVVRIDAAKCMPQGEVCGLGGCANPRSKSDDFGGGSTPMSLVCFKDGGGMVAGRGNLGGASVFRFDKDGKSAGKPRMIQNNTFRHIMAVSSLAAAGDKVLMTMDWPLPGDPRKKPNLGVWGRVLSKEGEVVEGGEEGFQVAVDGGKDRVQGFACAGPDRTVLIVYSDPRGVEDTKVVARLVK